MAIAGIRAGGTAEMQRLNRPAGTGAGFLWLTRHRNIGPSSDIPPGSSRLEVRKIMHLEFLRVVEHNPLALPDERFRHA